jgi:hypothetical protein
MNERVPDKVPAPRAPVKSAPNSLEKMVAFRRAIKQTCFDRMHWARRQQIDGNRQTSLRQLYEDSAHHVGQHLLAVPIPSAIEDEAMRDDRESRWMSGPPDPVDTMDARCTQSRQQECRMLEEHLEFEERLLSEMIADYEESSCVAYSSCPAFRHPMRGLDGQTSIGCVCGFCLDGQVSCCRVRVSMGRQRRIGDCDSWWVPNDGRFVCGSRALFPYDLSLDSLADGVRL